MQAGSCILVALLLFHTAIASAEPCEEVKEVQSTVRPGVAGDILAAVANDRKDRVDCGSLASVIHKAMERKPATGRKAEREKPLDMNAAQESLDAALRDPAVRNRFYRLEYDVPDQNVRLVYEAAILDEEGYDDARELRIRQLQQVLR